MRYQRSDTKNIHFQEDQDLALFVFVDVLLDHLKLCPHFNIYGKRVLRTIYKSFERSKGLRDGSFSLNLFKIYLVPHHCYCNLHSFEFNGNRMRFVLSRDKRNSCRIINFPARPVLNDTYRTQRY